MSLPAPTPTTRIAQVVSLTWQSVVRAGDRVVGAISPDAGLRRHMARQLLQRAYEGASKRDGWRPKRGGASANTDHAADAQTLRIRARSLRQNSPYVAQAMRALVAAVIGTGIIPRWTGPEADAHNKAWEASAGQLDADGKLDIYGLTALAYDAYEQDGEVLIRIRHRRPTDGLTVPIQFQVLEIDWLDSSKEGRSGGDTIVNGIQYDVLGKVAGYWLFDNHPGEHVGFAFARRSASSFVPAANIIHFYRLERPGQGRGFTRLAPVIALVRDLQLYKDAELHRKNLEARLSVLVSGDPAAMAAPPQLGGPTDQAAAAQARDLGPLASGAIQQVPQGTSVTVVAPHAAPGYVEAIKLSAHEIAAGVGVPYEAMTGDMSEVNFSSARIRAMDFRRECEMTQWQHVIPRLLARMCHVWADAAHLAGVVRRASHQLEYAPPKWDYVNPADDIKADLGEISGGLSSISEKLRRRGYKPETVFQELADDFNKLRALGVLDVMLLLQKGRAQDDGKPADPPGAAPKPAPTPARSDGSASPA